MYIEIKSIKWHVRRGSFFCKHFLSKSLWEQACTGKAKMIVSCKYSRMNSPLKKLAPTRTTLSHLMSCLFKHWGKCNENWLSEIENPFTCGISPLAMLGNGLGLVQSHKTNDDLIDLAESRIEEIWRWVQDRLFRSELFKYQNIERNLCKNGFVLFLPKWPF